MYTVLWNKLRCKYSERSISTINDAQKWQKMCASVSPTEGVVFSWLKAVPQ